jgi:hypothetical protein
VVKEVNRGSSLRGNSFDLKGIVQIIKAICVNKNAIRGNGIVNVKREGIIIVGREGKTIVMCFIASGEHCILGLGGIRGMRRTRVEH